MTATGPANLIKAQIKANLDSLVTAGVLGAVVERDLNTNILEEDIPGYPCAFLGSSDQTAEWEYSQANKRTYKFNILIAALKESIDSMGYIEDLRDAISLVFDNNVTLSGAAVLGASAAFSERAFYKSQEGRSLVLFNVTIRATTLVGLTYNF